MHYCEPCRQLNVWPQTTERSMGKCQQCGDKAYCHNHPSRTLPPERKNYGFDQNGDIERIIDSGVKPKRKRCPITGRFLRQKALV